MTQRNHFLVPLADQLKTPVAMMAAEFFYSGNPRAALALYPSIKSETASTVAAISNAKVDCATSRNLEVDIPAKKVKIAEPKPVQAVAQEIVTQEVVVQEKEVVVPELKIVKVPEWVIWCIPIVNLDKIPREMVEIQLLIKKIKKIEEYWIFGLVGTTIGYGDIKKGRIGLVVSGSLREELKKLKLGSFRAIGDYKYFQSP